MGVGKDDRRSLQLRRQFFERRTIRSPLDLIERDRQLHADHADHAGRRRTLSRIFPAACRTANCNGPGSLRGLFLSAAAWPRRSFRPETRYGLSRSAKCGRCRSPPVCHDRGVACASGRNDPLLPYDEPSRQTENRGNPRATGRAAEAPVARRAHCLRPWRVLSRMQRRGSFERRRQAHHRIPSRMFPTLSSCASTTAVVRDAAEVRWTSDDAIGVHFIRPGAEAGVPRFGRRQG